MSQAPHDSLAPPLPKRKAFIAAPLIGTILFLSAVLFTVNLNKIEASQSARIVNDAYHNRIVSLIEIYRTDLNSVFRESVRRSIQQYVLDPGWNNLKLQNVGDGRTFTGGQPLQSIKDVRYQRCEYIRRLSQDVLCILGSVPRDSSFGYGIPAWVDVANQSFSFEGINFRPANSDQMRLLNPPRDLTDPFARQQAFDSYNRACRNLVQENLFDCRYFADHSGIDSTHQFGPFQCKDQSGRPLPGCEQGTFYVRVDPRGISTTNPNGDPALFAALPRIEGDDGFGNQVRSGAIGDEPFYLPINLRVFFYDDFALEFYDKLAYGTAGGGGPGLADGICAAEAQGCIEKRFRSPPIGGSFPQNPTGLQRAKDAAANAALQRYNEAVRTLQIRRQALRTYELPPASAGAPQYYINFHLLFQDNPPSNQCLGTDRLPAPACQNVNAPRTPIDRTSIQTIPGLGPNWFAYPEASPTKYGAYYDQVDLTFFVLDSRPEFKVSGVEPNHPTYGMTFYYNPR